METIKRTKIVDLLKSTAFGSTVNVKGWVRTRRGSKQVNFIALNDGSTINNVQIVVDVDKLDPAIATPAFVNVNDGTNEGLQYTGKNIFTVQFHPEACLGPLDSGYLFDRFMKMMEVSE